MCPSESEHYQLPPRSNEATNPDDLPPPTANPPSVHARCRARPKRFNESIYDQPGEVHAILGVSASKGIRSISYSKGKCDGGSERGGGV